MKPALEFTGFATLALGLHVAAFGLMPGLGGGSAGDGGAQEVTLQAASPDLRATVRRWQTAPEAPVVDTAAPPAPAPDQPATPPAPAAATPQPQLSPRPEPQGAAAPTAPVSPGTPAPPLPDLPKPKAGDAPLPPPGSPAGAEPDNAPEPDLARPEAATPARAPELHTPSRAATLPAPPEASAPPMPQAAVPQADHALAPETSQRPPARPEPAQPEAPATARQTAPQQPAASQPAAPQRAQGSTEAASPNRSDRSREADSSGGPGAETLLAQWGGAVRGAVQRQLRGAGRLRGTVEIQITVRSDGALTGVALRRSSGHAALDQAALEAARRARIPPAPQGLSGAHRFNLPLSFR